MSSVSEILAEDEAVWIRPGDAQSLAACLCKPVADPGLARALSARVCVRARRYIWAQRGIDLALHTITRAA